LPLRRSPLAYSYQTPRSTARDSVLAFHKYAFLSTLISRSCFVFSLTVFPPHFGRSLDSSDNKTCSNRHCSRIVRHLHLTNARKSSRPIPQRASHDVIACALLRVMAAHTQCCAICTCRRRSPRPPLIRQSQAVALVLTLTTIVHIHGDAHDDDDDDDHGILFTHIAGSISH
jgi:hypothetical protein